MKNDDVADYFEKEGLGDYREVLTYHKIVSTYFDLTSISQDTV